MTYTFPDLAFEGVNPSLLLDIFGQQPIAFHRCYVDITGSITSALWLSNAVYHLIEQTVDAHGWFSKSQAEWESETGLSRREQESARKRLVELKILKERRPGLQRPMEYQLNVQVLMHLLDNNARMNNSIKRTDFLPLKSTGSQ